MNLEVDESIYGKNRSNVKKEESQFNGQPEDQQDNDYDQEVDNHKDNPDFTLLSDSKVMKGEGRAIVCAVGNNTYLARKRKKDHLIIEEERTLLEQKLENLSEIVGKWCYLFCGAIFLALMIYNFVHVFLRAATDEKKSFFSSETLMTLSRNVILVLCLLIVAIPEGMPLAISIAMAMSVDTMKKDNILIKNIESVQVCALLHEICVGKTGTLTEGKMNVASYQLLGELQVHPNHYNDPIKRSWFNEQMRIADRISSEHNDNLKGFIREAIIANSDVRMEVDEGDSETHTANYIAKGQGLECAMINFLT